MGSGPPEQLLCCQSPLQGPIWPGRPSDMLPSELGQAFRAPLGLSNKRTKGRQITKGMCCVPTFLPAWPHPLLCFESKGGLSLGMNWFSHSVAMVGFPISVCLTSLVWDRLRPDTAWREGCSTSTGLDLPAIPLKSPRSYWPTLTPPVRQCEYHTKLPFFEV